MSIESPQTSAWDQATAPMHSPSPTYRSSADGRLVSVSQPCTGLPVHTVLRQARGQERFFWEDVRDGIVYAGFGLAVNLLAWGEQRFTHIHEQARALFADAVIEGSSPGSSAPTPATPRLFGGFSFRSDFTPDNTWSVFHPAHFVLPHYQFVQVEDTAWLTLNVLLSPEEDPQTLLPQLREALQMRVETLLRAAVAASAAADTQPAAGPALKSVNFPMSRERWAQLIADAKKQFVTTKMRKVVLARVCEARFTERADVDGALAYLGREYANCYRFLFEPQPYHAFFGATPELLAKVDGSTVTSMAMAGSIERSDDPKEDAALGQRLIHSAKDRHEHQFVVVSLLQRMALATSGLDISPQPGLYRLKNIQHLYTPVRGRLLRPDGILPVAELIHPTPAMGGSPRELAMQFIRDSEPSPRGWYAGPIGWIDHNLDGAFAVAIRCAVTQDRRVWMYSGAGVVDGSDADREWRETNLKFEPMLHALGITDLTL